MEVKTISSQRSEYWCHFCNLAFTSDLKAGKDIILCPQCNNDFCEIRTRFNHPEKFKPYQKQPQKKNKNLKKIDKYAVRMTVNQLAQILEIQESQNFEVTEEVLQKLRKKVQITSQCSVCRVDLEPNEQGIIPDCKHVFHEQCLVQWIKRKNTCPTCRQRIISESIENKY